MMNYAAHSKPSDERQWRPEAERQYQAIRAALRETIQRARRRRQPVTADIVSAFAALHMRTFAGVPIAPAAHHRLWLHLMCDPHINRLLIIGTPESAKTTWALAYAACLIGFYPEQPGIIAAASGPVAEKRSLALRNLIESPEYTTTFPDVKPASGMPWTGTEWSVAIDGRPHAGRIHPTVSAYGTGGSVTGSRARWLIADDILDFDNTRTQHQRNLVNEWLHKSLLSRIMARVGRAVIIGNAWHFDDAHARLSNLEEWVTCRIPLLSATDAVEATITYPDDYDGEPLGRAVGIAA